MLSLACLLLPLADAADISARRPPNVILFLVDDLGWADTGIYGSSYHHTPNIDALARRGLRFTDAYAAAPVCSPTRAALLTGKSPARLHLTDWLPGPPAQPGARPRPPPTVAELPLAEVTLAERLQAAGYVTALIGKWHLGGKGAGPLEQGFSVNIGGDEAGTPRSYFYPYRDARGQIPGLAGGAPGEYLTDRLTTEALAFVERNRDRPFFLYLAHFAVHVPMQAKPAMVAGYRDGPRPARGQRNPVYAAMVESVDQSLGALLAELDRLGIADRTVVIVTSDNGGLSTVEGPDTPATDNTPLRAGKGYLYEGGIRVPLIIAGPGTTRAGVAESTPVTSMDLFATVLDLAGAAPASAVDGLSLRPLLDGSGTLPARDLYWHYPHYSPQGGRPGGVIRAGRYKLIEFYDDAHVELYDLVSDPGEERNLAGGIPGQVAAMRAGLARWRQASGAQAMAPAIKPWWQVWD